MSDLRPRVPAIPELPQLPSLLDAGVIAQILASLTAGRLPFRLAPGTVYRHLRTKYRPGKNCLVTWSLDGVIGSRPEERGTPRRQLLYLTFCRAGESRPAFDEAMAGRSGSSPSVLHLPEWESLLWCFPADRKLAGLTVLEEPKALISRLGDSLGLPSRGGRLEVTHYAAERSCSVRADLDGFPGRLFGKFYADEGAAAAWETQRALWESTARQEGRLVIAAPLVPPDESGSLWLGEVEGIELDRLALTDERLVTAMERAGEAIARLHQTSIGGRTGPDAPLPSPRRVLAFSVLGRAFPPLSARLARIGDQLDQQESSGSPLATLHGDLHLGNIFLQPTGEIGLIDFDTLSTGDPRLDLASLTGYLLYRALVTGRPLTEAFPLIELLLRGYCREAVDPGILGNPDPFRWYLAEALLSERMMRIVIRYKLEGFPVLDALLELIEDCLASPGNSVLGLDWHSHWRGTA
jgi:tRNA A-37 threonylcarbamoyl transferase component Bud32